MLLDRLAVLENAHPSVIDSTIEEFSSERQPDEAPKSFTGNKRDALDFAFRHDQVEEIFKDLESFVNHKDAAISQWAAETITILNLRSPTSLKVALKAIRKGKNMTLLEALDMELKIATAYCVSLNLLYIIQIFLSDKECLERCKSRFFRWCQGGGSRKITGTASLVSHFAERGF